MNFCINVAVIEAWIFYKESSWIKAAVFIILGIIVGSVITCAYIAIQFFKLSPEESLKDPLYFVLVKHQERNPMGHGTVLTARVVISALGCLMLGILIYLLILDGSPFRFSPCMIAAVIDCYFNVVALSVWVVYKESSWITAFFWILSLVCFGSIATCVYIVRQLFYLSPQEPASLVLFNSSNRDFLSSGPLLIARTNV